MQNERDIFAQLLAIRYCCNISGGVALNVWFTTNGMCVKKNTIYMWHEQAIIEWSHQVISIVACCHSTKLCAHTAQDFRSQQCISTRAQILLSYVAFDFKAIMETSLLSGIRFVINAYTLEQYKWNSETPLHFQQKLTHPKNYKWQLSFLVIQKLLWIQTGLNH